MRAFYALILLLSATLTLPAQVVQRGCGTSEVSEWLIRYQNGEVEVPQASGNETQYLPLRIIIVGDDNGGGRITPTTILNTLKTVNFDFDSLGKQFYIDGEMEFLDNSGYYDHEFAVGRQMMDRNNKNGTINVYFVGNPAGACGYYSGSRDAIAMGNNCTGSGDRTWSHELGHFFTLPHTFRGWDGEAIDEQDFNQAAPRFINGRQVEKADGSNCTSAGDGFCDTPADYLADRWACNGDGFYADTLTDPDTVKFLVPAWNIMSYAADRCVSAFSGEQKAAMRANIATERRDLERGFTPDPRAPLASEVDLIMPALNETLPYYNTVDLSWTSAEYADFYIVQLNTSDNFNGAVVGTYMTSDTALTINQEFRRNTRYWWRVRPVDQYNIESDYTATRRFKTGRELVSTIDPEFDAALTVSPNPVGNGQQLRVHAGDLSFSGGLDLHLLDATGRTLVRHNGIQVTGGRFTEYVDIDNLSPGVYFLRMLIADRMVTRRVMVR